jgi:hypothetical protein
MKAAGKKESKNIQIQFKKISPRESAFRKSSLGLRRVVG